MKTSLEEALREHWEPVVCDRAPYLAVAMVTKGPQFYQMFKCWFKAS